MPADPSLYPDDFPQEIASNPILERISGLEAIARLTVLSQRQNTLIAGQQVNNVQNKQTIVGNGRIPFNLVGTTFTEPDLGDVGTKGYWTGGQDGLTTRRKSSRFLFIAGSFVRVPFISYWPYSRPERKYSLRGTTIVHFDLFNETPELLSNRLTEERLSPIAGGNKLLGLVVGGWNGRSTGISDSKDLLSYSDETVSKLEEKLTQKIFEGTSQSTSNFMYMFGGNIRGRYRSRNSYADSVEKISLNQPYTSQELVGVTLSEGRICGPSKCAASSSKFWIMGGRIYYTPANIIESFDLSGEVLSLLTETLPDNMAQGAIVGNDTYNWVLGGRKAIFGAAIDEIVNFNNATETASLSSNTLSVKRYSVSGVQSSERGYLSGGYDRSRSSWPLSTKEVEKLSSLSDIDPTLVLKGEYLDSYYSESPGLSDYSPSFV